MVDNWVYYMGCIFRSLMDVLTYDSAMMLITFTDYVLRDCHPESVLRKGLRLQL